MRPPLTVKDQFAAVSLYLRTVRHDFNRSYRRSLAGHRHRHVTPLLEALRHRRVKQAYETIEIDELCLRELRHVRALSLAAHFPGDPMN